VLSTSVAWSDVISHAKLFFSSFLPISRKTPVENHCYESYGKNQILKVLFFRYHNKQLFTDAWYWCHRHITIAKI